MSSLADRIGADAQVHRTSRAMVYQVSGSVQDLDFLGWILRTGLAAPDESQFDSARRTAQIDLDQRRETPEGALAIRLLGQLSPGAAPLQGTRSTLERLDPGRVTALWARSHLRSEVRIVVAGRVDPILVLSTLSDLGLPMDGPTAQLPPSEAVEQSTGAPEVIRHWIALGHRLDSHGTHAEHLITARLLGEVLRESPGNYEAAVELWEVGRNRALVLSGAAFPGNRQPLFDRLNALPQQAIDEVTESRVDRISSQIRTELRNSAREPRGLAELVGQAWDMEGSPEAVGALLASLREVDPEGIQQLLDALQQAGPLTEEIRP